MRFKLAMLAALGALTLTGCAASGPAPTSVKLDIAGTANMNGGAPAKIKVYYLASTGTFRSSDFFQVFNTPEATLGPDLIAVDEFQLSPGRTVTDSRNFPTAPGAIGVVAAFRDIDSAKFLDVRQLAPNTANTVRVVVSGKSVSIR
ncbi:type VI secretion system lipoprotein TssJ [Rhizobium halophytocola]|uniref:Type VI secretion system protein VasD n=1 Tax=Rhizobium halophytocola TaxID=735519 RepID=A0ABS4E3G4_9HYPH|nr:type VI secretion system lipoprotein TssJ [Rhizobium halophytocola]MBP1852494.1 type VI secretion system protein VasD [Rhizobium halophytocola]